MGYISAVITKLISVVFDTYGRRIRKWLTETVEEQSEAGDNKTKHIDTNSEIEY